MTEAAHNGSSTSEAVLRTLLVSDLVDSTRMVERLGDQHSFELFGRHDRIARDLLEAHEGLEIDKTDGFLLLFERPIDAVRYAIAYHQALDHLSVEVEAKVSSRVGIHLGEVYLRENPPEDVARGAKPLEVEGLAKPTAARLMSVGQGRQTLLTRGAFDLARRAAVGRSEEDAALQWMAHGAYRFKGVHEPVNVFEVGITDFSPLSPPPDTAKVHRVVEDETILGWRPAPEQAIPQRPNWALLRKLGEGGFGEVWLAEHAKTHDQRVFKFCFDRERLKGLQREVTLFRMLKENLGNRDDIARILDWNFDAPPYFVESEFTEGGSLLDWAAEHGGIESLALEQRLEVVAQVAEALSAAHSVGVLHKDLKPGNVLVRLDHEGRIHARLTDFGIGMVTDRERLTASGITVLGFTEDSLLDDTAASGGTQLYMAPELLEGLPASVQADIYALGVMLYQLLTGNLKHALAPGWERDIDNQLLREDVAALVDGDPALRARDAGEVASRLRGLDERRAQREAEQRAEQEAAEVHAALVRSRRRQKLSAAVLAFLVVFASAMGVQSWRIKQQKDRAEREARRAEQEAQTSTRVLDYVIHLFDALNPETARGREITVREVFDRGSENIDKELHDQPEVRSRLKHILARVYFSLGDYETAEDLWRSTIELQKSTLGPTDVVVATSLMNLAGVHLQQGRLADASELLQQALTIKEETLGADHPEVADLLVNLSTLRGFQGDHNQEIALAERALEVYEQSRDSQDLQVARILNNLGDAYVKTDRVQEAEKAFERALSIWINSEGEDHPETARIQTNLAQLHGNLGHAEEAEQLYRSALATREKVLGSEHPLVAVTQHRLAVLVAGDGRFAEAHELVAKALGIAETTFGSEHQLTAEVLTSRGEVARLAGRLEAAEQDLRSALATLERILGADNPEITPTVVALARVLRDRGVTDEARRLFERALKIRESALGAEHPEVAAIRSELEELP